MSIRRRLLLCLTLFLVFTVLVVLSNSEAALPTGKGGWPPTEGKKWDRLLYQKSSLSHYSSSRPVQRGAAIFPTGAR